MNQHIETEKKFDGAAICILDFISTLFFSTFTILAKICSFSNLFDKSRSNSILLCDLVLGLFYMDFIELEVNNL